LEDLAASLGPAAGLDHQTALAFTNARGVLYHGAKLDPGVKYPPNSEHERAHGLIGKLMP
jgi:hypothetical protein